MRADAKFDGQVYTVMPLPGQMGEMRNKFNVGDFSVHSEIGMHASYPSVKSEILCRSGTVSAQSPNVSTRP